MDEFINNAIVNNDYIFDEADKDGQTLKNTMSNSFHQDKNTEELIFLYIEEWDAFFKYNNKFLYYDIGLNKWHNVCYEVLNNDNKDNCKLVKLIKNSSTNIEFILHPFFTEEEKREINLNPEYLADMSNAKIIFECVYDDCINVEWKDGFRLCINTNINGSNTYMIKKDKHFVSGFIDKQFNFQLGDCETIVYMLNNGEIMVHNCGDVNSIVIIRFI